MYPIASCVLQTCLYTPRQILFNLSSLLIYLRSHSCSSLSEALVSVISTVSCTGCRHRSTRTSLLPAFYYTISSSVWLSATSPRHFILCPYAETWNRKTCWSIERVNSSLPTSVSPEHLASQSKSEVQLETIHRLYTRLNTQSCLKLKCIRNVWLPNSSSSLFVADTLTR